MSAKVPQDPAPADGLPARPFPGNGGEIALITLSVQGARLLAPLAGRLAGARLYLHEAVPWPLKTGPTAPQRETSLPGERSQESIGTGDPTPDGRPVSETPSLPGGTDKTPTGKVPRGGATKAPNPPGIDGGTAFPGSGIAVERFTRIADLTAALFPACRGLVFAAPCGVVVRAIAPLIHHKHADPAVVVLDVLARWAVSLLSGHEGGANDLALSVANLTGAEPVITTTTEALKNVIVGVGCRRGTPAERIVRAIRETLTDQGIDPAEVRLIASAQIKADEPGLIAAAAALGIPLRFVAAAEIRAAARPFARSAFVQEKVGLPAVAEPTALLAGRRTVLICPKRTFGGITVALAREGAPSPDETASSSETGNPGPSV